MTSMLFMTPMGGEEDRGDYHIWHQWGLQRLEDESFCIGGGYVGNCHQARQVGCNEMS